MSLNIYANKKLGTTKDLASVKEYSTTEINTGNKWVDGKTIYRKVVTFGALTNSADNVVGTISNVNKVIPPLTGIAYRGGMAVTLPNVERGNFEWSIGLGFNKTTGQIIVSKAGYGTYDSGYVYIEYTKTTD